MIIYSNATLPATLVVSLTEMKAWLKIDGTDEDTLLSSLIASATAECEAYAGMSFITRTRTVKLTSFGGKDLILPYGPVTALTSITYSDEDDVSQTIDSADYTLDSSSSLAKVRVTETWPYTNRVLNNVTVTYVAGYANAAAVPEVIKTAIKKRVAFHYEHRGDESIDSTDWMTSLDSVRVYWNAEYAES
jgi:uncharacterized phiE125 gp8 family phage protein